MAVAAVMAAGVGAEAGAAVVVLMLVVVALRAGLVLVVAMTALVAVAAVAVAVMAAGVGAEAGAAVVLSAGAVVAVMVVVMADRAALADSARGRLVGTGARPAPPLARQPPPRESLAREALASWPPRPGPAWALGAPAGRGSPRRRNPPVDGLPPRERWRLKWLESRWL
jgi:hypothetical protein